MKLHHEGLIDGDHQTIDTWQYAPDVLVSAMKRPDSEVHLVCGRGGQPQLVMAPVGQHGVVTPVRNAPTCATAADLHAFAVERFATV